MSAPGVRSVRWILKIVPVSRGYDVYSETPVMAFYGHATTLEEAKAIASRQPTREESARMLRTSL